MGRRIREAAPHLRRAGPGPRTHLGAGGAPAPAPPSPSTRACVTGPRPRRDRQPRSASPHPLLCPTRPRSESLPSARAAPGVRPKSLARSPFLRDATFARATLASALRGRSGNTRPSWDARAGPRLLPRVVLGLSEVPGVLTRPRRRRVSARLPGTPAAPRGSGAPTASGAGAGAAQSPARAWAPWLSWLKRLSCKQEILGSTPSGASAFPLLGKLISPLTPQLPVLHCVQCYCKL